jgi:hypothetical protein
MWEESMASSRRRTEGSLSGLVGSTLSVTALVAGLILGGMLSGTVGFAQAPTAAQPPTPRAPDGKPDLTGIWIPGVRGGGASRYDEQGGETVFAARDNSFENFENDNALRRLGDRNKPLYKPEHWAKVRENDANGNELDPEFKCRPYGVPRMGAPSQIVQTKDQVVLLYAGGFAGQNTFRVVPTDGRPHNQARVTQETWKGDPVGHWEGDTLVIETIGFTDESWLHKSGYFHGFKLKVVERITRTGNTLRWVATVDDPEVLIEPWTMNPVTRVLDARPDAFVAEDLPCEERDLQHMVTKVRSG